MISSTLRFPCVFTISFISKMGSVQNQSEFYTSERCFIKEYHSDPTDPFVSIAAARVEPGVTTALHFNKDTTERFVFMQGTGVLHIGDREYHVKPGDCQIVPANVPQCLRNNGDEDLVFSCTCTPRFRPETYVDLEKGTHVQPGRPLSLESSVIRSTDNKYFEFEGIKIKEMYTRTCSTELMSLAEAVVLPGKSVKKHHHNILTEKYWIVSGEGDMHLNDKVVHVGPGDVINIVPGTVHSVINNSGDQDLVIHVVCTPAWAMSDEIYD